MKKLFFSLVLISGLIISCNDSKKEEKTETKDTTVQPTPAPVTTPAPANPDDTTGKGEQNPPPVKN